ncbi:MAG: glycosyltransferase family 4 protein [Bacteroidota bacterium]
MKVLHFKTNYLNPSETFIDRLVRNHEHFEPVIATCYAKNFVDQLNVHEMPKTGIKGFINTIQLKLNRSPSFLFDVARTEQPDIIHGHFGLDSYRLIQLHQKTNIPFIVNFYGHDVIRLPREIGWKSRYKKMAKYMSWAIAGSEDMKRNLVKLGFDEDRITTIKLAVNIADIEFVHRKKAGPKLMMVGRCVEKKGFIYALKALKEIKKEIPDITLDLYGDGELLPELKTFSEQYNLQNQVTFHGFTENKKVFKALYEHDILLVPSVQAKDGDREGIPQTTVEGMATGIPVIASEHAGLPELVKNEETGLLIPTRDSGAIVQAVLQLIQNSSVVDKVSIEGRNQVSKDHNLKTQVKKTEELYTKLIHDT